MEERNDILDKDLVIEGANSSYKTTERKPIYGYSNVGHNVIPNSWVYKGVDCTDPKLPVAIKRVPEYSKTARSSIQEPILVSRLSNKHSNIQNFLEDQPILSENFYHIFSQLYDDNLFQVCRKELEHPSNMIFLFRQAVAGLLFLHLNHLIHQDLKPENYFISSDPSFEDKRRRLMIADFGTAFFQKPSSPSSHHRGILLLEQANVDHRLLHAEEFFSHGQPEQTTGGIPEIDLAFRIFKERGSSGPRPTITSDSDIYSMGRSFSQKKTGVPCPPCLVNILEVMTREKPEERRQFYRLVQDPQGPLALNLFEIQFGTYRKPLEFTPFEWNSELESYLQPFFDEIPPSFKLRFGSPRLMELIRRIMIVSMLSIKGYTSKSFHATLLKELHQIYGELTKISGSVFAFEKELCRDIEKEFFVPVVNMVVSKFKECKEDMPFHWETQIEVSVGLYLLEKKLNHLSPNAKSELQSLTLYSLIDLYLRKGPSSDKRRLAFFDQLKAKVDISKIVAFDRNCTTHFSLPIDNPMSCWAPYNPFHQ